MLEPIEYLAMFVHVHKKEHLPLVSNTFSNGMIARFWGPCLEVLCQEYEHSVGRYEMNRAQQSSGLQPHRE